MKPLATVRGRYIIGFGAGKNRSGAGGGAAVLRQESLRGGLAKISELQYSILRKALRDFTHRL